MLRQLVSRTVREGLELRGAEVVLGWAEVLRTDAGLEVLKMESEFETLW